MSASPFYINSDKITTVSGSNKIDLTLPNTGTNSEVVTTEGNSTINGTKTFAGTLRTDTITPATTNNGVTIDNLKFQTSALTTPAITVCRLEAQPTATNACLILRPKGTGCISMNLPDNTTTGGNVRGSNAVDFQTTRTSADQVAGGNFSAVISGSNNRTVGGRTAVIAGTGNVLSGASSGIVGGSGNSSGLSGSNVGITGGASNIVNSTSSGMTGGSTNQIYAPTSGIVGGEGHIVNSTGTSCAMIGGTTNQSAAPASGIVGGSGHTMSSAGTSGGMTGGNFNQVNANAGGTVGGATNVVSGNFGGLVGGATNTASGPNSGIVGGTGNVASGNYSAVVGSFNCLASGQYSACISGEGCVAAGNTSFASGRYASALNDGCIVLADGTRTDAGSALTSTADHQFTCDFSNGYRFNGGSVSFNDRSFSRSNLTGSTTGTATAVLSVVSLNNNSVYSFTCDVVGITSGLNTTVLRSSARVKNNSGTLTKGPNFATSSSADGALTSASVDFIISGTTVSLRVSGVSGQTINWSGTLSWIYHTV